jgi:zinc transport system permease protein
MLDAVLKYTFMQNAILSAVLASIVCGIIGTVIVEKKLVMMAGGISHACFGGVGLGYLIGIEPIIGAMFTALLSAFGMAYTNHNVKTNEDTLAGMVWPLGMSLGILFVSLTPGYPPSLDSYLFGDILTVSKTDLWMTGILIVILFAFLIPFLQPLKTYLFDKEFARLNGIPTDLADYVLYVFIALSVTVLIRVVGIILVIALLTIPASIVRIFTFKFNRMMIYAALCGMVMCLGGLALSYLLNVPSGAVIVLLGALMYAASAVGSKIVTGLKKGRP